MRSDLAAAGPMQTQPDNYTIPKCIICLYCFLNATISISCSNSVCTREKCTFCRFRGFFPHFCFFIVFVVVGGGGGAVDLAVELCNRAMSIRLL